MISKGSKKNRIKQDAVLFQQNLGKKTAPENVSILYNRVIMLLEYGVRENCKLGYHLLISRLVCKLSDINLLITRYEVSYRNSCKSISFQKQKTNKKTKNVSKKYGYVKDSQICPSTFKKITSKFLLCIFLG